MSSRAGTDVDVFDPDVYVDGPPHEVFEHLRRSDPVHWQDLSDAEGGGAWAVLKHDDVMHVARHPEVFSAERGGVVLEDLPEETLALMRNMLLAMDPPRHRVYRRPLEEHFRARVIGAMEDQIRGICRSILQRALDAREVEFVHDVCALLPSQVVGELMGLPESDWPRIHAWAERNTSAQDADVAGDGDDAATNASIEMAMYAIEFAARRRAEEPRDDLTTLILSTEFDGEPMSDVDFGSFFVQLVTAGNDTTKTMLSSALLALLRHPEQMAAVWDDASLVPGAVEETLRWANPLHYFRRTAVEDTTLRGAEISAGQKVVMVYTSANRDEDVFDDPHRFDLHRDPNPHLAFGIGEHHCIGAHLARLEGRVFFEELVAATAGVELMGEPARVRSNLNNALKRLPVRLQPA